LAILSIRVLYIYSLLSSIDNQSRSVSTYYNSIIINQEVFLPILYSIYTIGGFRLNILEAITRGVYRILFKIPLYTLLRTLLRIL